MYIFLHIFYPKIFSKTINNIIKNPLPTACWEIILKSIGKSQREDGTYVSRDTLLHTTTTTTHALVISTDKAKILNF